MLCFSSVQSTAAWRRKRALNCGEHLPAVPSLYLDCLNSTSFDDLLYQCVDEYQAVIPIRENFWMPCGGNHILLQKQYIVFCINICRFIQWFFKKSVLLRHSVSALLWHDAGGYTLPALHHLHRVFSKIPSAERDPSRYFLPVSQFLNQIGSPRQLRG